MKEKKKIFLTYTKEELDYLDKNNFFYVQAKAEIILTRGVLTYLKKDFFQASLNVSSEDIPIIELGCTQILNGAGMFEKQPIQHLGVSGINLLMQIFHFQPKSRKTKYGFRYNNTKGALDRLEFHHIVDKRRIIILNFCEYENQ
jgi:hypothetical protein